MVRMISLSAAVSLGVSYALPPEAATSATASLLISHIFRSYPAFSRFLAMGFPMIPRPIKPIFICKFPPCSAAFRRLSRK